MLASLWPAAGHPDELTLAAAVRMALARNERPRIAELTVVTAEASLAKARAGFLPSISLTGNEALRPYSVQDSNGRTTLRSNAASGAVTVSQPVFSLPAFPLYASAQHQLEATRQGAVELRRQLSFDAARAFFGVVAQQRVLLAAQHRLERAEASSKDTRARAEAQLVSSNDLTRAEVDRSASLQSLAAARNSLEQARIGLSLLLDAPVDSELTPGAEGLAPPKLDAASLATQALDQRPDLAAAREAALAARSAADEPALRFAPSLGASAQARGADSQIAGDRYWDTTLTLNLTWAIWDAGTRGADEASRLAAAHTADLQARALARRVQADVRAAIAELVEARSAFEAAQGGVEAARRNVDETGVLYKQGLAKAIELVDANLSFFDSEVSLAGAQLSVRQAELDLRAALGLFPIEDVR